MSKMTKSGPYIHTHQNIYFIQKGIYLQFVLITNYQKLGLLLRIKKKKHTKAILGHFFASKASDASHPQVHFQYLKYFFPRQGEQCSVVEFPTWITPHLSAHVMATKHIQANA